MSKLTSSALRNLLLVARQHGLCCVALLAYIRHRGYQVPQVQDLSDAQAREITKIIRERFDHVD